MGADATLVAAAYRMGMANVPHDFSASFNKQYEGIIAANQAFADMLSEIPKGVAHVGEKAAERRREDDLWDKEYMMAQIDAAGDSSGSPFKFLGDEYKAGLDVSSKESLATDLLKSKASANGSIYKEDGGLNKSFFDAAHRVPYDLYDKLKKINAKTFPNAEDRANKSLLYQDLENWKRQRIQDKGNIKYVCDAINSDLVNHNLTHPELKVLMGQLIDQKADLNDLGINIFTRDGDYRTMIEYTTNRMETEYQYNKRLEEQTMTKVPFKSEQDPETEGLVGPKKEKVIPPYEEGRMEVPQTVITSLDELVSNIRLKQVESERIVVGGINSMIEDAADRDEKSNTFKFKWDGLGGAGTKLQKTLRNTIKNKAVVADLSTRDIFAKDSTYRQDLGNLVFNMDLSKMGVEDMGEKGYQDDFSGVKGLLLKEDVINRLTNPQTTEEFEFAKENIIDYFTTMGKNVFDDKRNEILAADREKENEKGGRGGGGFTGDQLSFGYKSALQIKSKKNQIESESPEVKTFDGITMTWNPEEQVYEGGGQTMTKRQLLVYNELDTYYPDLFLTTDVTEEENEELNKDLKKETSTKKTPWYKGLFSSTPTPGSPKY